MAKDEAFREAEKRIERVLRDEAVYRSFARTGLTELPKSLGELSHLRMLRLDRNRLTNLPEWLGDLSKLKILYLPKNQLTDLPSSLAQLEQLKILKLDDNPLNPELAAAYEQGLDAVMDYLRELAKGARDRYEAKLLILGDGGEGKTCVSRAVRGLPFKPQVTTRGVDVEPWPFAHPDHPSDEAKQITLNIWDFEGQEINHQTHQFFLTSQSLYLLVFKCREQFPRDRAEYWLDTIRARAPDAKVAIVITGCEERRPYLPEDRLQAEYADLLGEDQWLFTVGCADGTGVAELQAYLNRSAADLRIMGRQWPDSYDRAESEIQKQADAEKTHVDRSQLDAIFKGAEIAETSYDEVATSMSTLGIITQFADCPDLRDFVVLRPQWLTKAISHVMEDQQLFDDKGEISFERMEEIWDAQGYPALFSVFHNCLKEFELCYDLEDRLHTCLLPLRFGYKKPAIPWTAGENIRERRVQYKLTIRPPMGLMSRFIVKTHHMIARSEESPKGVYWHNGVFLRTGSDHLCSEALCEFDLDERTLSIQVRAAFPQNLIEQVHGYAKAVFAFFSGLKPVRSFGCIRLDEEEAEKQCDGAHSENKISFALESQEKVACEDGRHHIDPKLLIYGISSFGNEISQSLRHELDKTPAWAEPLIQNIGTIVRWVDENQGTLDELLKNQAHLTPAFQQELDQKLREYLAHVDEMLDGRQQTAAPGIFSLAPVDGSRWNPKSYFKAKYALTPFCECEGNIHACDDGKFEFQKNKQWWDKTAPWIARGTKILSVGLQLAITGMPLAVGDAAYEAVKHDVTFMKELAKHAGSQAGSSADGDILAHDATQGFADEPGRSWKDLRGDAKEARLMRTSLARFLEEVARVNFQAGQWGSLRRVRMSDNSYRWLCEECARRRR